MVFFFFLPAIKQSKRTNPMRREQLCHKLLSNALSKIHQSRQKTLIDAVISLANSNRLTLTELGRNFPGKTKTKHKIKRADRLLNNGLLYGDRIPIYQGSFNLLVGRPSRVILLVDWSPYQHKRIYGVLRASCVFDGRSITVYEEVHAYKKVMQQRTQKHFMQIVQSILPQNCQVIVVSDAGFLHAWFTLILSLGWHFVGRLRLDIKFKAASGDWKALKDVEAQATLTPKRYRETYIFKQKPFCVNLVTKRKSRQEKAYEFSKNPMIKQYQKQSKQAWVLATSLCFHPKRIVKIYSKRMQIETGFRDHKNHRYGLGLSMSLQRTDCLIRRTILLIIAHLTLLFLLLIGFMAEQNSWQYDFQSNSSKKRRVLSFVSLGRQVFKNPFRKIRLRDVQRTLSEIALFIEEPV
jgi:Transposase DDE domain